MLFPTKVKVALVGLVVAGGAAAAVALGPAGPAVGQSSQPISVQVAVNSPATLVASGAGVDVFVTATCSGTLSISANVTEKVGRYSATGYGTAAFNCTGTAQRVKVLAIANGGGKAFVEGSATTQVTAGSAGAQRTVTIRNS